MAAPGVGSVLETYLPVVQELGLNTLKNINFNSGSNTCDLPASTTIDGAAVAGIGNISSSSTTAVAFSVTNSGIYTGTGVVTVTANSLTTGVALLVTGSGVIATTGALISVVAAGATSAAGVVRIVTNALTSGIALSVASSATAMTSTGRLLSITHTGNAGVSTIIAEVASAAADETVIMQVTASAALALGAVLKLSAAAVTTGSVLVATNADALTTGSIANLTSNSADTTARKLLQVVNDNTAAVGAVPLYLQQDAVGTTHFKTMILLNTFGLYVSDETTPNGALTAAKGSICLNGSATGQTYWNTDGSTAWTALA